MDIKAGRFVGLGLGVRPGRRHTKMHAYLQDVDNGTVVAVERVFTDPDPTGGDQPKSFTDLAAQSLSRGISLQSAAISQLLLGSGKRTPTDELVLPRGAGKLTANPQTFQWEQLAPPLAIENFNQARERFESLPPDWLRPRRHTENLHVLRIAGVSDAVFDVVDQQLTATLHDAAGNTVRLIHPYHSRGEQGFNELLHTLQSRGSEVRFACGHLRLINQQLQIQPISLVLESENQSRIAVSVWLGTGTPSEMSKRVDVPDQQSSRSAIADFVTRLQDQLSEVLVIGLVQSRQHDWVELSDAAQRLGFVRLVTPIQTVATQLSDRPNQLRWNAAPAAKAIKQLCMLSRIMD